MSRDILLKLGLYRATLVFTVVANLVAVALAAVVNTLLKGGPSPMDLFTAVVLASLMGISFGFATLRLIFKLLSAEDELRTLSMQDNLTGAHNRRYFIQLVEREWERFRRYKHPFAVVIFDIDSFKKINDCYGHLAGDEVLRQVAEVCARQARAVDTFARFGGDEFVFLAPNSDQFDLPVFLERIRKRIEETHVQYKNHTPKITVSMGAMQVNDDMQGCDAVLLGAYQALSHAKRLGGNCYSIWEGDP